jgi:hypothetical protein
MGVKPQRPVSTDRKIPIVTGSVIIFLVIIDLLMTRQILAYSNDTGLIMFVLTIVVGYGIGSWILLRYTGQVSQEIRSKSRFINLMYWMVLITQFSLLGILLFVLLSNTTGIWPPAVFAISSIAASIIMGIIAFKFFWWYKLIDKKNLTVLLYGIAAILLAVAIAQEAGSKLLLIEIVQEKSPPGAVTQDSFVYKHSDKYNGEIEYKIVNPQTTTLYILPDSYNQLYVGLASTVIPIAFVIRWLASTTLLRSSYQRIGKLPPSLWIILSLPVILYLVGKMPGFLTGESLQGVDEEYRYFFRLLFRIGTIGGNIVFGLAFFMIARQITSLKLRDYLTITAIGDTIVGIALSTSALQQTFGIAGHSLVLLASFLFSMGLYLSVISLAQDNALRQSIRRSMAGVIDNIGTAQMEKETEKRVMKVIRDQHKIIEEQTGGYSEALTDNDMKEYMQMVVEERKSKQDDVTNEK